MGVQMSKYINHKSPASQGNVWMYGWMGCANVLHNCKLAVLPQSGGRIIYRFLCGFICVSLCQSIKIKRTNMYIARPRAINSLTIVCLLNRSFRCRSKKTSKLRVTGCVRGVTGEFPAQMARNAENVSIRWRHHTVFWRNVPMISYHIDATCIMYNKNSTIKNHRGRVTHIYVSKLIIIGADNGLSPGRRQAIIWTSAGILLIGPLWTNFSEISIGILTFSFKKMHLKASSAKRRPFCLGLNVLIEYGV